MFFEERGLFRSPPGRFHVRFRCAIYELSELPENEARKS